METTLTYLEVIYREAEEIDKALPNNEMKYFENILVVKEVLSLYNA
jgi:hypothetical protein